MSWRWFAPNPMAKIQQNIKITLHFSEKVYDRLYFPKVSLIWKVKKVTTHHPYIELIVTNVVFVFSAL